jgi:hypothetical protein
MPMPLKPDAPRPAVTYECSACGVTHRTGGGLPVGWSAIPLQGLTWCNDCTAEGAPRRDISDRRAA